MKTEQIKETPILMCGEMVRAILRGIDPKTQTRRVCRHQHWTHSELHDANYEGFLQKVDRNVSSPYGGPGDRLWVKETWSTSHALRETKPRNLQPVFPCEYRAGGTNLSAYASLIDREKKWRPAIFMPRHASRITLDLVTVRVERLQDITQADAIAEGIDRNGYGWRDYLIPTKGDGFAPQMCAVASYKSLWNSINLKPKPIYERDAAGKRQIVAYESFPWREEDIYERYPGPWLSKKYRGKPLTVVPNPWVWVVTFKRIGGAQ